MRHRAVITGALVAVLLVGCGGGGDATSGERGGGARYEADAGDGGGISEAPLPSGEQGDPNTFTDPGTNPWTAPTDDAQSTFGLDVDTGSWTVSRRFVADGSLPPPEAVRTEEFVNALGDVDPAPDDTVGVTAEGGRVGERLMLRLGVTAHEVSEQERPPVDLVFVIDTSGSMQGEEKIGLVQDSLALLVANLRADDTVSIVTFDDGPEPTLPPTPISESDTIMDVISGLEAGGSTNLEGGLRLGYETADGIHAQQEDAITRVVLLSDGVANVGETGPGSLVELIRDSADTGIKLVTVGFGLNGFNDALMEQVADDGDGFYAYVDDIDEAERLFGEELTSTLVTVAEDARAQVTFDPATVARYRLVGYENRDIADEDFARDETDAGELGAGHRVVALYEVEPTAGIGGDVDLGSVELRWDDPAGGDERTMTTPIGVTVDGEAPTATQVAVAAADLAEALRTDQRSADALERVADRLDALSAQVDDPTVADMAALARQASTLV